MITAIIILSFILFIYTFVRVEFHLTAKKIIEMTDTELLNEIKDYHHVDDYHDMLMDEMYERGLL